MPRCLPELELIFTAFAVRLFYSSISAFDNCGMQPIAPSVNWTGTLGWHPAQPHSWPWQALVYQDGADGLICGAVLIEPMWVMSTAHCINTAVPEQLSVKLGASMLGTDGDFNRQELDNQQVLGVQKIFVHPDFAKESFSHDIALLRLKKQAKMTTYVIPLCLPEPVLRFKEGSKLVVTGWGAMFSPSPYREFLRLQQLVTETIDLERCQKLNKVMPLDASSICGTTRTAKDGSCGLDFGAPVVYKQGLRWVLAGLVSWDTCLRLPGFPAIYSNVSSHLSWIKETMKSI